MPKLRYDEAYQYARDFMRESPLYPQKGVHKFIAGDFAGFVVGADWRGVEPWPIEELWSEFLSLTAP